MRTRVSCLLVLLSSLFASVPALAQGTPVTGIAKVSAGTLHTCALTTTGGVRCWGWGEKGQLGNGYALLQVTPIDVVGLGATITAISSGGEHTCALTNTGTVKCWGANANGQLGDNSTTNALAPVDVPGLSGVTAIAAGGAHTCAIVAGGGVKCWGRNDAGQLGDGTTTDRLIPTDVSGPLSGITAIAAGGAHTCARLSAGALKCWGANDKGQVGDGSTTSRSAPVDVSGVASGAVTLAAGDRHTCSIFSNGGTKCWGYNAFGQLGDSSNSDRLVPVNVTGFTSGVAAIATGANHTCAQTTVGVAKCWGQNNEGQVGDESLLHRNLPVDTITLVSSVAGIAAGGTHSCALSPTGGVKCWGNDAFGQLGTTTDTKTPVATDVTGLQSSVTAIAGGFSHTCAIGASGALRCWGSAATGQVGNNLSATNFLVSVVVPQLAANVTSIAAGVLHSCAVTASGSVYCWGHNADSQLGDGSITQATIPVAVSGLASGASQVVTGEAHSCVLMTSGGVKCWGRNDYGQLGDVSNSTRSVPTNVSGLASGVIAIAAGYNHTCAIVTGGGVKCWGRNDHGQLGVSSPAMVLSPIDVTAIGTGVTAISAGEGHTCAVKTGGALHCWGRNDFGQLGDNSTGQRATPALVSGLSSGIASVAAGFSHTCALTTGGAVKCWGRNDCGQLGDTSNIGRLVPVDVAGLASGVAKITTGSAHSCAATTTGAAKCWGAAGNGQIGNGTAMRRLSPVNVVAQPLDTTPNPFSFASQIQVPASTVRTSGTVAMTGLTGAAPVTLVGGEYSVGCTGSFTALPGTINNADTICVRHTSAATPATSITTTLTIGGVIATFTTTTAPVTARMRDLSGEGRSDVVLRGPGGEVVAWLMNGTAIGSSALMLSAGTGYQVVRFGDFNGDGRMDLLLRGTAGDVVVWLMNGATVTASAFVLGAGTGYVVDQLGDFNGDGRTDLLLKGAAGDLAVWLMNGTAVSSSAVVLGAGTGYSPVAVGDFDHDGRSDLVLAHTDGRIAMWLMNGTAIGSSVDLLGAGTGYTVTHAADFNNDTRDDLLLKGPAGEVVMWEMNGTTIAASTLLYGGGAWLVSHVADVNNDGSADMMLKGPGGEIVIWQMNGATITGATLMYGGGPWAITHAGDYDGDSMADLLLKGPGGEIVVWLMNGSTISSATLLIGATTWQAAP